MEGNTQTNQAIQAHDKTNTAMQKVKKSGTLKGLKTNELVSVLNAYQAQISQALPKHMKADKFIQIMTTLLSRSPGLAECTIQSIVGGMMQASILGLEPIPAKGDCYLVPFLNDKIKQKEATFIIGYKGMIKMARKSGEVKMVQAYSVHLGDEFHYEFGLEPIIKHIPGLEVERTKENLLYVYGVVKYVNGGYNFVVLTKKDIEKTKSTSKGGKSAYSPWNTHYIQMALKTAIRRLSTWMPLEVENAHFSAGYIADGKVVRLDQLQSDGSGINLLDVPDEPEQIEENIPEAEVVENQEPIVDIAESRRKIENLKTEALNENQTVNKETGEVKEKPERRTRKKKEEPVIDRFMGYNEKIVDFFQMKNTGADDQFAIDIGKYQIITTYLEPGKYVVSRGSSVAGSEVINDPFSDLVKMQEYIQNWIVTYTKLEGTSKEPEQAKTDPKAHLIAAIVSQLKELGLAFNEEQDSYTKEDPITESYLDVIIVEIEGEPIEFDILLSLNGEEQAFRTQDFNEIRAKNEIFISATKSKPEETNDKPKLL